MLTLGDFQVVYLGTEYSDYFQGFGSEGFDCCTYGIGHTEEEALDDCIEMMSQNTDLEIYEEIENKIRAAYGECAKTSADDYCDDPSDCTDHPWHYVGIRWNEIEG